MSSCCFCSFLFQNFFNSLFFWVLNLVTCYFFLLFFNNFILILKNLQITYDVKKTSTNSWLMIWKRPSSKWLDSARNRRPLSAPTRACYSGRMSDEAPRRSGVDPKLLEILVCPATHGPLEYDAAAGELISRKAGLAYPIRDGIPIMLVSEARQLTGNS